MSLRATEGGPPWGTDVSAEPEPKGSNTKLIILGVAVAVVIALLVATLTGVVSVPFIGSKTITVGDPAYGWALTLPKNWAAKAQVASDPTVGVRYQAEGDGVGVRVQSHLFDPAIPADQIHGDVVLGSLKKLIATGRPDVTINEGPTFGSINGVQYIRYIFTYTDFSSGVAIPLKDHDYYFFNGPKLDEVTMEVTAAKYSQRVADFNKTIQTFRSGHATVKGSPAVTNTATVTPTAH